MSPQFFTSALDGGFICNAECGMKKSWKRNHDMWLNVGSLKS
jgi:hypothetical protein